MQTARLLEPRPRNIGSKLIEMVRAVQLEARLSKRGLLALYLTLAPYGGNLEGVRAASLSYFGHEPETLTAGEQAMLIALPQSPESRRPDRRPEAARAARRAVLDKMIRAGVISEADAAEAEAEDLPARAPFPALAWHVAGELARAAPKSQARVAPRTARRRRRPRPGSRRHRRHRGRRDQGPRRPRRRGLGGPHPPRGLDRHDAG
jgi:penicillin-binding protein 1C